MLRIAVRQRDPRKRDMIGWLIAAMGLDLSKILNVNTVLLHANKVRYHSAKEYITDAHYCAPRLPIAAHGRMSQVFPLS